jgi:hypothetical protein
MPTDELEHELRRALAKAASGYQHPELARQRLLQRNYRPGSSHRLLAAGLTCAAAAGAVVLGLGLSGTFGSAAAHGTGTRGSVAARGNNTIRTAAFTLTRNVDGTDTLTLNATVLSDPGTLQNDLARYGIPAKVTIGSFCFSDPAPAGFSRVVTFPPYKWPNLAFTINLAAMPAGTELSFGKFQLPNGQETAFGLINTNAYTCSSAPTNQALKGASGVARQLELPKQ